VGEQKTGSGVRMKSILNRCFPERFGLMPYVYLTYWFVDVYYMFALRETATKTLIGFSFLLLFLAAYRQSYYWWQSRKTYATFAVQLLIIVVLVLNYQPGFVYLFFYVVAPIGSLPTVREIWISVLTVFATLSLSVQFTRVPSDHVTIADFLPLGISMIMMPFGVRVFNRWRQTNHELQVANEQIGRLTQQAERERIARDLHDILGHTLSMITLKSELAEKLVRRDPDRAVKEIHDVQVASRSALQQVREVVSNMHSVSLQDELDNASRFLTAANINYLLRGEAEKLQVSSLAATILAMCLREAVTNVVRHSQATFCVIEMGQSQTCTEIRVNDNGIGLTPIDHGDGQKGGHGLYGMKQRLELVGGTLHLLAGEPQGTVVVISIPRIVSGRGEEAIG
jgi:two-component system, NarL family, sensor histidine kinase DesK